MTSYPHKVAFSLVELSIVLVILGLLVGGVLSGQALIRAAELRSLSTELGRYTTAVNVFRDKYFALPGDMTNATSFWGKDVAACNSQSGAGTSPGTCNGDGDGSFSGAGAPSSTGEDWQSWKQLALAGLIEGTFSGLSGPSDRQQDLTGTNSPKSRVSGGGWGFHNRSNFGGDGGYLRYDYGNFLVVGSTSCSSCYSDGKLLRPEEAWNLDTKLDDGVPGSGRIVALNWSTCTTSTTSSDLLGSYKLSEKAISCSLTFTKM